MREYGSINQVKLAKHYHGMKFSQLNNNSKNQVSWEVIYIRPIIMEHT